MGNNPKQCTYYLVTDKSVDHSHTHENFRLILLLNIKESSHENFLSIIVLLLTSLATVAQTTDTTIILERKRNL